MTAERGPLPELVPLFPLPDHVLLPGLPTPYRIFEPRYRALIAALLERPEDERWLAVPRLAPGWRGDYEGSPPFLEVATVGRMVECEPQADGEYSIVVIGEERARLVERASPYPYRLAAPVAHRDRVLTIDQRTRLDTLVEALVQSAAAFARAAGEPGQPLLRLLRGRDDASLLVYRLGGLLVHDPDRREALLFDGDPLHRADVVLEQIATLLHLQQERGEGGGLAEA